MQTYSETETLALSMWVKLARAFAVFNKGSCDHIRTTGLTPTQFAVVECLGHKGRMTLGELSSKMLMSCGNITVVIDNLEKEGLVLRSRCPQDRRVIHAELTPEGHTLLAKIFPEHARVIAQMASALSISEQHQLAALLKKLGTSITGSG